MSLLSICQAVCDEIGFPRPSSIAANPDQLARQLFALANKELRELSKVKQWPVLERHYNFSVVAGQDTYALPAGFSSFIPDTAYTGLATPTHYSFVGSITAREWRIRKMQMANPLMRYAFRLKGGSIVIDPVPVDGDTTDFNMEYITSYFAQDSTFATLKPQYVLDDDVALVSEDLVQMGLQWRIKHAKGLEFSADQDEYELAVARDYAKAILLPTLSVGHPRSFWYDGIDPLFVPLTGYGDAA